MTDGHRHEATLIRFIRAPRQTVFDAFVKAGMASRWLCPRGMSVPSIQIDARVGGRFVVTMRARNGAQFVAGGVYRELARPERLAFSWAWQDPVRKGVETAVAVHLIERAAGTELRLTHAGFPDAAMREAHEEGWASCLNQLTDLTDERGQAATLTLFGDPRSTYVRSARMGLAEKGLRHSLQPLAPHTPEMLALHPFGRVPAFRDGRLTIFETSAILRYVDETFPGPALMPRTVRDRAHCEQWASAVSSYLYGTMIRNYVLQYLFPKGEGGKPDRSVIEAAAQEMDGQLAILERAYGGREYLVGSAPSMADLLLAPILYYVELFPEGKALLQKHSGVLGAQAAIRDRASFRDTAPPG